MADKTGIAIIGCGMISEFQSKAIGALPDARVAGFFDTVPDMARRRAAEFGGKAFATIEEMLADPSVDAVSICTPSGTHMEPSVQAAKAGKHVMVEKPIEITTERVDAILRACRESGVILGAIFPRRFSESSRLVKKTIDEGRFGRIVLASVYIKWYRSQEYYDQGGWRGTWKLDGGGALMNQGIHGIDLVQWLLGGIREVSALTATLGHERIEVEDVAAANVRFANGALGCIEGTTGSWPGAKIKIEIGGMKGSVILEDEALLSWRFQDEGPADEEIRKKYGPQVSASGGGAGDPRAISFEGHRLQFEDFVRAIRTKGRPYCGGEDARAAVAVITSIYRSAKEGRRITVE
jgi:predicted dehydrogenase